MADTFTPDSLKILLSSYNPAASLRLADVACILGTIYTVFKLGQVARRRLKTTALRGPPNPSFVWGVDKALLMSADSGLQYEKWAEEYGGVYEVSSALGGRRIILCDPKAIAHLYGREPWTYVLAPSTKIATENLVGKGMLSAKGENHRRQRKIFAQSFGGTAIRNLTPVYYDSAYKVKGAWDSLIGSTECGSAIIEVQNWMNHISLDTIGIAGFSHDFGSLDGKKTSVTEVFDALCNIGDNPNVLLVVLAVAAFPWLKNLPSPYSNLIKRLNDTMGEITNELLMRLRKEEEADALGEEEEKSLLGLLIRAENRNQFHLTHEELTSQAKVLLVAGYETISVSLTWALIELSRKPDIQTKLRAELIQFGADPTYDQLFNNLPYLDAVVHETLRMHAPITEAFRTAEEDDVIPLSKPVQTRSGELVDHITIAKGTDLLVSAPCTNRSTALWGSDAKEFKPERWVDEDGIPAAAKEIQGHRHLLTFLDGPRTCLGKGFALTEFKIVLSVLVKNFVFELRDGPDTKIETVTGILPRPNVAGEDGAAVPLCVRHFNDERS